MNIYVSNLSFNVTDEDLRESFAAYGEVTSAKVVNDRETGRSRGFGFVEMADEAASKKAIAELDNTTLDNRAIKVVEARPKEDRPARRTSSPFRSDSSGGGYNDKSYNKDRFN